MAKENKKPITINELARMVEKGFEGAPTNIGMNSRFDTLEHKMKGEFTQVRGDISHLRATVSQVQSDIGAIKTQLTIVERLERLEKEVFGQPAGITK